MTVSIMYQDNRSNTHAATSPELEEGEIVELTHRAQRSNKIGYYWLHNGECRRDPSQPSKPARPCAHAHRIDPDDFNPKISHVPVWLHKFACGIAVCPYKAGPKKTKSTAAKGRITQLASPDDIVQAQTLSEEENKTASNPRKRKRADSKAMPNKTKNAKFGGTCLYIPSAPNLLHY